MKKVEVEKHQPSCLFAHELINKLAAIVGHSDLLKERLTGDAESLLRLDRIREIAAFTAQALAKHQCVLDAALKSQMAKKSVSQRLASPNRPRAISPDSEFCYPVLDL